MVRRFLGGHTRDAGEQGCNWLVECLCPECKSRELWYLEDGGRLLTVEEFYEHCGGDPGDADKGAWRTGILVQSSGGSCDEVRKPFSLEFIRVGCESAEFSVY